MAEDKQLLVDLALELGLHQLRPLYHLKYTQQRLPGRASSEAVADFALQSGQDNLGQAVMLRLLTPRGELTALGHPEYGSRMYEVIGLQNTETTRNLLKLYILESLAQEPRIAQVVEVTVAPVPAVRHFVSVTCRVQPTGPASVVTIGPFTLEL